MSRLMIKQTKWHVHQAKSQIILGFSPVWSESSLSARRKLESLATHCAHSEDWSLGTIILLVLSRGSSFLHCQYDTWALWQNMFMAHVKNKGTHQPVYLHSLISVCYLLLNFKVLDSFYTQAGDRGLSYLVSHLKRHGWFEPRHKKTCLQGLRPGKTQTGLHSHRD